MLEHAVYSVISPEGAASILWRDTARAQDAATSMKITADDLMRFAVIDEIIREPKGGAHRNPSAAMQAVREAVAAAFQSPHPMGPCAIPTPRQNKILTA